MARADEILRRARTAAGLTQDQLAIRAGIAQASISNIESGKIEPSFARLRALVMLTGHELDVGVRRRPLRIDDSLYLHSLRSLPEERLENTVRLSRFTQATRGSAERAHTDRLIRELEEIASS